MHALPDGHDAMFKPEAGLPVIRPQRLAVQQLPTHR
jgi:hypothetical protein